MPETTHPALRVGLILGERFTLSAFANFVDVLRLAADEGDRSRPIRCRWSVLSSDMAPVRSSCGVSVGPNERLGDASRFDYVVVVGGLLDDVGRLAPEYAAFLHRAAAAGIPLVGLCTGAFLLHDAGLMQGYRCCVSWFHHEDFLERFDGIEPVSDRIFVVDRDRLTCSGGASAAHLAAHLVDRHIGTSAARKSLHILIIDDAMPADEPQPILPSDLHTRDPLVRRAILHMQQHMDSAPSVTRIAEAMEVSRRKLERHFLRAIALTPSEAFLRLRLSQARLLLETSGRTVTEIAAETGFCDASHLARVFREREGVTPDAWRRSTARSTAQA
ncbi:GlxA family transcriptional regulator [Oceaniglobus roseus]|uniref:GlxA family transcriptional regulator n=1 Tax=Oceaniglobus roseus TaxID=1737570 RepID=UPI000C7F5113|nr:GlxA family transcriptional regulator [Kandeliimicrobium roseum]